MYKSLQGLMLAAGLGLAASAHAVVLDPRGQGQVLIFPYYTASAGNTTLIALTNNSEDGRIVQLRVAEGNIGDTALVLNIYLAGRDSWSGTISMNGGRSGAVLFSDDASCVLPTLGTALPDQPGRRMQPLELAGAPPDAQARTVEGWVEAIEVATVQQNSATDLAIGNVPHVARDCAALAAAWTAPGGYWTTLPTRDLGNPRGGLSGYSAVINVAAGTYFDVAAVALDDFRIDPADRPRGTFSSVVRHFVPGAQQLTLADAITDPQADSVRASVVFDGHALTLSYPLERAIDAVSAVLAAAELSADFDTRRDVGAMTSFVNVFPTKRFYTNPALLPPDATAPLPPFRTMYNTQAPFSVIERHDIRVVDSEAADLIHQVLIGGCESGARHPATALAVIVPGREPPDPLLGTRFHGTINTVCAEVLGGPLNAAGHVTLMLSSWASGSNAVALRPSRESLRMAGLPVIATRLTRYVSTGTQRSVLANDSSALPMSARARCLDVTGEPCIP